MKSYRGEATIMVFGTALGGVTETLTVGARDDLMPPLCFLPQATGIVRPRPNNGEGEYELSLQSIRPADWYQRKVSRNVPAVANRVIRLIDYPAGRSLVIHRTTTSEAQSCFPPAYFPPAPNPVGARGEICRFGCSNSRHPPAGPNVIAGPTHQTIRLLLGVAALPQTGRGSNDG
jgi:hypothetical protein